MISFFCLLPLPPLTSLLSDITFNLVLKKNLGEWAESASSTAPSQGGDKNQPPWLKMSVIAWYCLADSEPLVGLGQCADGGFQELRSSSQAQHQKHITLSVFANYPLNFQGCIVIAPSSPQLFRSIPSLSLCNFLILVYPPFAVISTKD